MVGSAIRNSQAINTAFTCDYLNLTLAEDLEDIGKGSIRKLQHYVSLLKIIRNRVRDFKPDFCYITPNAKGGAFYKDFIIVELLKSMGCGVIAHYHNKGVSSMQERWFDNLLYRQLFKRLKVILLAEPLYSDIRKYVKRENVYICPNGILSVSRGNEKLVNERFNILFLSNMMVEKGVYTLLDACSVLKDMGKDFDCHFVGKWSDITACAFEKHVESLSLTNYVHAHGPKYGADKIDFFTKADVLVFPTYYHNETFGLVLLEAMDFQIPCLSTNEGGIPTVIDDGNTGFVVKSQDPEALAEKINFLMEHPQVRKEMGVAGKKKFDAEFTLAHFEKKMIEILKEVLNQDVQN